MIFFRKLHKWLGLLIGLQVLVWVITGSLISLLDARTASGSLTWLPAGDSAILATYGPLVPMEDLVIPREAVRSVSLESFYSRAVYRVDLPGKKILFDASTGTRLEVDQVLAERIALASYGGEGQLSSALKLHAGSDELRGASGTLWRVGFSDSLATRVYISGQDGSVLGHRNDRWALIDFLLMLHFMDYLYTDNFNNPQIIVVAFGTLWLAFSGLLLVFFSFSRNDFRWLPGMASSGNFVSITVGTCDETKGSVSLDVALSLYAGLTHQGINLPSNCDGSGSCGLCKVQYDNNPPQATAVDRQWIRTDGLANGERLACQHKPRTGDSIIVPQVALQGSELSGEVVSSQWLTSLLKEIRVRPDRPVDFSPGEHFQFQIPVGIILRHQMGLPEQYQQAWDTMAIPGSWPCDEACARTYSVASAPSQDDTLTFTVRFFSSPVGSGLPPGVGSGYMCSLKPGDRVAFRGPSGDFHLIESSKEKIFIGGGAGMAPLKSMVLHLLENKSWQGKLRYWYGARNQGEILYRDIFEALAAQHPNFEWRVGLSDAADDASWPGEHGFIHQLVHDLVLRDHQSLSNCEFYICGPPLMLAATRAMLADLGVPGGAIRFDDFDS